MRSVRRLVEKRKIFCLKDIFLLRFYLTLLDLIEPSNSSLISSSKPTLSPMAPTGRFWGKKHVLIIAATLVGPSTTIGKAFPVASLGRSPRKSSTKILHDHIENYSLIEGLDVQNRKLKIKVATTLLRSVWNLASWIGMRRLGKFLKRSYPSAYGDTIFCWDDAATDGSVQGYVALTIDDGLCRNYNGSDASSCSMVQEVRELLQSYNALATFFVCTDYLPSPGTEEEANIVGGLLNDGNEFGNHLREDISGYYCHLDKEAFRKELVHANRVLNTWNIGHTKWFRAPQGRMTKSMREVIQEVGMVHVLGDYYCDDWAFAEDGDASIVAPLMLNQVHRGGSIAIFHMPERGFREASFHALKDFLEGAKERNLRCITLTEMESIIRLRD